MEEFDAIITLLPISIPPFPQMCTKEFMEQLLPIDTFSFPYIFTGKRMWLFFPNFLNSSL
jgi:hypothetical protein